MNKKHSCLQDFVVCLGEIKSPQVSLIDDKSVIWKLLQYLQILLNVQHRRLVYGFLTNFTTITFFYVEKNLCSNSYKYYQSQNLKMFHYLSETSSSIDMITTNEQLRKAYFNKDTWKIFTKFLTINIDFYDYIALNINPLDDLLGDRYNIRRKLGRGTIKMVFLLEKNEDNYSNDDLQHCVMKILTHSAYMPYMPNEVKTIQQLKQMNNLDKFNLFFEDLLYASPS
ncbi:unnamed protein product, partial [Rotaria sp. Silwood1]